MKIVLLSDIHSRMPSGARLEAELRSADMVIISGDITGFGSYSNGARIIEAIRCQNNAIFAVAGNCDTDEVARMLEDYNVSVHGSLHKCCGLGIIGVSGVERGRMPFTFYNILENAYCTSVLMPLIVVSHEPAWGVKTCGTRSSYRGNENIKQFTVEFSPVLAVSGHIHEAWGYEKQGDTVYINPGSWLDGRFAVVTLDSKMKFINAEFYSD